MKENQTPLINRDLSWLYFNYRVLLEAVDESVPLFEIIKFLSIYSSNLDEFFRVRVASIQSLCRLDKKKINKKLSISPKELLEEIHDVVVKNQEEFGNALKNAILPELEKQGIHVYYDQKIPKEFLPQLEHYFRSKVLAHICPYIFDINLEAPFLENRGIYLAVSLNSKEADDKTYYGYVKIPADTFSRFYQVTSDNSGHHFVFLDDIIKEFLPIIFQGYEIISCFEIKLNKSADLNIEDEYSGDLVEKITKHLSKREIGIPSRFLYDSSISEDVLKKFTESFHLSDDELVAGGPYHNLHDFMKLVNPIAPKLQEYDQPMLQSELLDQGNSIFEAIKTRDCILHFPYHSYDYVLRFFNEAAIDPKVEEIKITLYRIAANSLIANALINAAKNGKKVVVFVELKARFDEENNIRWAKKMEKAGVRIIYSIPGLKVHAKVALVKRKASDGDLKGYAFFGTGNFNENTASIYADHGLLTSHQEMIEELDQVFRHLHRRDDQPEFNHLLVSQFNLQPELIRLIDREIEYQNNGSTGKIILKLNNLEDPLMIQKLYQASQAGVSITLLIRGICCLIPGMEGISENITLYRLVDRYLEHARIYYFYNDGKPDMYLGSADWMGRNLYRRIEVCFPIYQKDIRDELIHFMEVQLADNVKLKQLDQRHQHHSMGNPESQGKFRAQEELYLWLKTGKKCELPKALLAQ